MECQNLFSGKNEKKKKKKKKKKEEKRKNFFKMLPAENFIQFYTEY